MSSISKKMKYFCSIKTSKNPKDCELKLKDWIPVFLIILCGIGVFLADAYSNNLFLLLTLPVFFMYIPSVVVGLYVLFKELVD